MVRPTTLAAASCLAFLSATATATSGAPEFRQLATTCDGLDCGKKGTCVVEGDVASCVCEDNWAGVNCEIARPRASFELTFVRREHLNLLDAVLQDIVDNPNGPTGSSRKMYTFSMAMTMAWNYIRPSIASQAGTVYPGKKRFPQRGEISGVHDGWDFDAQRSSIELSPPDCSLWMMHTMVNLMNDFFVPSYSSGDAFARERADRGWTKAFQKAEAARVAEGTYKPFRDAFAAWFAARADDGSSDPARGAYQATVADVPSLATPLDVTSSADPGDSKTWMPLKYSNGVTQGYLGYNWKSVTSTFLSAEDEAELAAYVATFYPSDQQWLDELEDVLTISNTLTDADKISSELWAGGPTTVIPPGQFGWFWKDYVRRFLPEGHKSGSGEMDAQMLSMLDLGVRLFEGGRVTWAAKRAHMQSRPIQEIRNRLRDRPYQDVFGGGEVSTNLWMPYQMQDFVTPPFPDFPSGHSHFSAAFKNTMNKWFGPDIDRYELPAAMMEPWHVRQLSPLFETSTSTEPTPFMSFILNAGSSEIQPGRVPASAMEYGSEYDTWAEVATACGFSRLTGGIHVVSAHYSSASLADMLHEKVEDSWGIVPGSPDIFP